MHAATVRVTIIIGLCLAILPAIFMAVASAGTDNFRTDFAYPPILIAILPLLVLRTKFARIAGGLSGVGLLLFLFPRWGLYGLLYMPAALAMLLAACAPPASPPEENDRT